MKYTYYSLIIFFSVNLNLTAQVVPQGFLVSAVIPSVVIGTQTWMTKDLDVTNYKDGTFIPEAQTTVDWIRFINNPGVNSDAWVYPSEADVSGNFYKSNPDYGKLYNWYAVTKSLGVCPVNWHVPTTTEWTTLYTFLSGSTVAGGKLKEAGSLHWASGNIADNSSNFTAIPGGYMGGGASLGWPTRGYYWASDEYSSTLGNTYYLEPTSTAIIKTTVQGKVNGCAIRCIHD